MLRVLVINLPSAPERWKTFVERHAGLGIEFMRVSAIDGRTQDFNSFRRFYDSKRSCRTKAEELRDGQLGCFASHYQLWQRCVDLDEPIIVLEDDVFLHREQFLHFLEHIDKIPEAVECLRLFPNMRGADKYKAIPAFELSEKMRILKYTSGPMSTMGYFLRPSGARKLLAASQVWYLPVDITMDRFWVHGVESFGIDPPAVEHDYGFESIITYPPRPKRTLRDKINRERFATRERLLRGLANLRFRLRLKLFNRL